MARVLLLMKTHNTCYPRPSITCHFLRKHCRPKVPGNWDFLSPLKNGGLGGTGGLKRKDKGGICGFISQQFVTLNLEAIFIWDFGVNRGLVDNSHF